MGKVSAKTAARKMREEYGERYCDHCDLCCNYQPKNKTEPTKICIAFGEMCVWSGEERACGLFNTPFRGIRPKRLPLGDYLGVSGAGKRQSSGNNEQSSLF